MLLEDAPLSRPMFGDCLSTRSSSLLAAHVVGHDGTWLRELAPAVPAPGQHAAWKIADARVVATGHALQRKMAGSTAMIIARERFLDATKDLHLTLSLSTRTGKMHSLLSNVPDAAREAISDILVEALDRAEQQLKAHVVRPATEP